MALLKSGKDCAGVYCVTLIEPNCVLLGGENILRELAPADVVKKDRQHNPSNYITERYVPHYDNELHSPDGK